MCPYPIITSAVQLEDLFEVGLVRSIMDGMVAVFRLPPLRPVYVRIPAKRQLYLYNVSIFLIAYAYTIA